MTHHCDHTFKDDDPLPCTEGSDGNFYLYGNVWSLQVNFCPYCGAMAPAGLEAQRERQWAIAERIIAERADLMAALAKT